MSQKYQSKYKKTKPPITNIGIIGWIKKNFFNGWFNSLLTLLILYFLWITVPCFIKWSLFDSIWNLSGYQEQGNEGACWAVISENFRFIIFRFYPQNLQWRPLIAMILLIVLLFYSQNRNHWKKSLLYAWVIGLFFMGLLLAGGLLGLKPVESHKWGGLPLTLLLSIFGLTAAYPLGIVLALGRQSKMPIIKYFCIIYIELIRGVPLISLLFMSSVVFPLFLPEGINLNAILRAQAAIILFTAAYLAEIVRGGLQAIDQGQYEAAESLGISYFNTMRLIILPQALKIVIPPSMSMLISAFKDTSLVAIISLYDLLKTTQTTLTDPKWMRFSTEAYIFVGLIYFICCFFMSNYSRRLERELDTTL